MSDVAGSAGARLFIGPVLVVKTVKAMDDEAALTFYEAIDSGDWTEVEEVESFGAFGDTSQVATFAAMKDKRVRKLKTTRDAGTMSVVVGRDALDDGQIALEAAEKTDFNYAFKIVYNDAPDEESSPSTEYFGGMVMTRATNLGSVQDVTKRNFDIAINTAIIADATDPTGS